MKQSQTDTSANKHLQKWKNIGGILLALLIVGGFLCLLIFDHLRQGYSVGSLFIP